MKRIFKKLFIFIVIGFVIISSIIINIPIRVHADSSLRRYLGIASWDSANHMNTITYYAYYDDSLNVKPYAYWYYMEAEAYLQCFSEEYEQSYNYGVLMIFYGSFESGNLFNVESTTDDYQELNIYSSIYNVGYNQGATEVGEASYQQGVRYGTEITEQYYSEGNDGYSEIFSDGQEAGRNEYAYGTGKYWNIYNAGKDDGVQIGYNRAIDEGVAPDSNFYLMLRQVAKYPVEIFTEGLDVDIFGVNIGGFLLGLGMVVIVITLLRKIRGL